MIFGDKILKPVSLVYHNLGAFFASRGVTVVIPDYRRVNSPFGGEGAVYPSGAVDLSLTLKWVTENLIKREEGSRDLVIVGNSAGGVHIGTFLLSDDFIEQRRALVAGKDGVTLKGAIGLAVPFCFSNLGPEMQDTISAYYGSIERAMEVDPQGLLATLQRKGLSREEAAVPKMLALLGEFDPEDGIGRPMKSFTELWRQVWGEQSVELEVVKGHNHISPTWSLMAGEAEGEEWGERIVRWIKN